MGKIFAMTSGKGGVGKSTLSIGLAYAFCKKNKKVLLIDMDEGLRCLDLMLNVEGESVFDLSDILMGREIEDGVYSCGLSENLFLVPAPDFHGKIDAFAFSNFAETVCKMYDIVIFDFPAGIDFSLYSCLPKETLFLTVAVTDPVSVRDAGAVSFQLEQKGLNSRLIINRFNYKHCKKYRSKNIDSIIDTASIRLIGIIPESEELLMFSLKRKLKKRGNAFRAFNRIAERLEENSCPLPKLKKI